MLVFAADTRRQTALHYASSRGGYTAAAFPFAGIPEFGKAGAVDVTPAIASRSVSGHHEPAVPAAYFSFANPKEDQIEGAPVRFRAIEDCEASGIPIPAGAYFGKERIQTTDDHPASRAFLYSVELTERGKSLDVTPLVEVGKIAVVRQSAL